MLEWQAICAVICRLNVKSADLTLSCQLLALRPWSAIASIKQTTYRWKRSRIFNVLSSCRM